MKVVRTTRTLEKTNIPCPYPSSHSDVFYAIFRRKGDQVKKSLKTTDKELARRRLEALRQKVARLNTKAGKAIVFADLAKRWLHARRHFQYRIPSLLLTVSLPAKPGLVLLQIRAPSLPSTSFRR